MKIKLTSFAFLATACLSTALHTSRSHAQIDPLPRLTNHNFIDDGTFLKNLKIGDIPSITPSFSAVRMPTGMTKRCDNQGNQPLPSNDLIRYDYGTAGIGLPFQASTAPIFGAPLGMINPFGAPDMLMNPGTHYNSLVPLAAPPTAGGRFVAVPNPTINIPGPDDPDHPIDRFGGGSFAVSQGKITGSVTDLKGSFGDTGASYIVVTFEETYEVTGSGSLGGALAFSVKLPKSVPLLNQIPGAAAVALTTTMVGDGGNDVIQIAGEEFDLGCLRLGSIVASVSEGVDDGIDNLNTGPQENFFGNSDVGKIVDGDFGSFFGLTGGVTISSKSINTIAGITPVDEVYEVAGVWNTPTLNFIGGPTKVTLRHTLTMIADPGATIQLRSLTQSEFDILPTSADVFVFASGTIVPEPSSLAMLSMLLLGLGSVRRSRRQL